MCTHTRDLIMHLRPVLPICLNPRSKKQALFSFFEKIVHWLSCEKAIGVYTCSMVSYNGRILPSQIEFPLNALTSVKHSRIIDQVRKAVSNPSNKVTKYLQQPPIEKYVFMLRKYRQQQELRAFSFLGVILNACIIEHADFSDPLPVGTKLGVDNHQVQAKENPYDLFQVSGSKRFAPSTQETHVLEKNGLSFCLYFLLLGYYVSWQLETTQSTWIGTG